MKYLDKYKIFENDSDNNLETLKKDLEILKKIAVKLNNVVKKEFGDKWVDIEFLYNGPEMPGQDSDYLFDELSIDDMARYMKQYEFPLYESNLSFGVIANLETEYVKKHLDIRKLTNKNIYHIINNPKDFSTEVYINELKYESLQMEEGYKVQKKLENMGFIVQDLETNNNGVWMDVSYPVKNYFEKNKKMFLNINK